MYVKRNHFIIFCHFPYSLSFSRLKGNEVPLGRCDSIGELCRDKAPDHLSSFLVGGFFGLDLLSIKRYIKEKRK